MAYIVDSVPEFVNLTMSKPKRVQILSEASLVIGEGVTKSIPSDNESLISCTTTGFKCPAKMAPKPIERSKSFRPSTSVIQAPLAEAIEIG